MSTDTHRITCGNCHKKHTNSDEVKACYNGSNGKAGVPAYATDPATDKQITFVKRLMEDKDTSSADKMFDRPILDTMANVVADRLVTKREVSDLISALSQCPAKPSGKFANVPAGKYATVGVTADGVVEFWEVSKPTEGKWAGRIFINMLVGSPGDWRSIRTSHIVTTAAGDLIAADPQGAARLFGYKTKTCGKCGSPLSHVRSRAAGYGKHCAELIGWPYPTKDEALRALKEMGEDLTDIDQEEE
jgi:hypothetical protein